MTRNARALALAAAGLALAAAVIAPPRLAADTRSAGPATYEQAPKTDGKKKKGQSKGSTHGSNSGE